MEKFLEMGERDKPFDVEEDDSEEAYLELYGDSKGKKVDVKYNDWFANKGEERYLSEGHVLSVTNKQFSADR
jgi:hypothetical protein